VFDSEVGVNRFLFNCTFSAAAICRAAYLDVFLRNAHGLPRVPLSINLDAIFIVVREFRNDFSTRIGKSLVWMRPR
jgi:hypothetical protein